MLRLSVPRVSPGQDHACAGARRGRAARAPAAAPRQPPPAPCRRVELWRLLGVPSQPQAINAIAQRPNRERRMPLYHSLTQKRITSASTLPLPGARSALRWR